MKNIFLRLFHLFIILKFCESRCYESWPRCGKLENIVCERGGDCSETPGCSILDKDESFRRAIVDEHNKLRSKVAQGEENRGGNGAAADMMAISYDVELEFTAQCNVNYCTFGHDQCRITKKHKTAGQNLYTATGKAIVFDEARVRKAIDSWYEEAEGTSEAVLTSYDPAGKEIGHFTQIVWAKTTRIGCAKAKKGINFYLACNYGEGGNMIGAPVYTKGAACSKCPDSLPCNTKYKGLCGEVDESEFTRAPLKGSRLSFSYCVSLGVPLVLISFKFWYVLY